VALDDQFFAERNAALVVNAETYYRAMFGRRLNTWNLRDAHMGDTLFALAEHRMRRGGSGRVVIWAHNSHVGDARATESRARGEWNLGQLVREHVGESDALLVGFTTYTGYVSAASEWGGEVEHKWVRPALTGSYEHMFHDSHLDRFFLSLREPGVERLHESMLERAIGVLYVPHTERASHYFDASLAAQFDAVFHLDETMAVEPLDVPLHWHEPEPAQV
jgi:erythromycin esterase-like protein